MILRGQITKEISKNEIALKFFSTEKRLIRCGYSLTLELSILIIYGALVPIVTSAATLAMKLWAEVPVDSIVIFGRAPATVTLYKDPPKALPAKPVFQLESLLSS